MYPTWVRPNLSRKHLIWLLRIVRNKNLSLFAWGVGNKDKYFIQLARTVSVLKLFSLTLMLKANELGCLFMNSFYSLIQYLMAVLGDCSSRYSSWVCSNLTCKLNSTLQRLARNKHLNLFAQGVSKKENYYTKQAPEVSFFLCPYNQIV